MRDDRFDGDTTALSRMLDGIFHTYHYDFRNYRKPSMHRRIDQALSALGSESIDDLHAHVVRDPRVFSRLLRHLTVSVTDFFRDPSYYRAFREQVVPYLATYPFIRIWVPGCASGEEAYSLAMVLREEGLLERSLVYATDIDGVRLEQAQSGVYARDRLEAMTANHAASGGRKDASAHYTTGYSHVAMRRVLKKHIIFADHSLATDNAFAEVQFVSCRNVLIYFDADLQHRALGVIHESLCPRGFVGLGAKENLRFSQHGTKFESFVEGERIYRLR